MFRAALCHLCVDAQIAAFALDKYIGLYPAFAVTREYKLVKVSGNKGKSKAAYIPIGKSTV